MEKIKLRSSKHPWNVGGADGVAVGTDVGTVVGVAVMGAAEVGEMLSCCSESTVGLRDKSRNWPAPKHENTHPKTIK